MRQVAIKKRPIVELGWRAGALAAIFALELTIISVWLDDASLTGQTGIAGFIRDWGAWILRVIVGFATLFGALIWRRNLAVLDELKTRIVQSPVRPIYLLAHGCAMGVFTVLSYLMFRGGVRSWDSDQTAVEWLGTGMAAILLAALSFIPASAWKKMIGGTGYLWFYALLAVVAACIAGNQSRKLFIPTSRVTFRLVQAMLDTTFSGVVADPSTMRLGTQRFAEEIAPECSGFEGMSLIAAFGVVWLVLFRKEYRFPQALFLIPAGVTAIFLLNAVRIATLIAIGDRGFEKVALGGFHSQAGWIGFNIVALGFSAGAGHVPWFTTKSSIQAVTARADNPVTPWVLPFVVILTAGMLSRALSADFEWLYPIRLAAVGAALWANRRVYSSLDWRVGWTGPAAGLAVFLVWIALDRTSGSDSMPAALSSELPLARWSWIAARAVAAIATVPVAEELAFRGFMIRRITAAEFESVPFRKVSMTAILVSSLLFGLLHGERWIAGTVAGLVYAFVLIRSGKITECMVAHASTNALIAADVLVFRQWHLW